MGASSVTGTGHGDAEVTRGPGNGRDQYGSLVDPHIVWHGRKTLTKGTALIYLPSTISVPPTHLAVFTGGTGWVQMKIVQNGLMTGFLVLGGEEYIDYIVVNANNACFCDQYDQLGP